MGAPFLFEHSTFFSPKSAPALLREIPALPGVFALHGPPPAEGQPAAQPYLARTADLRRRIARMLAPPEIAADGTPVQSKRLNLSRRVARIEFTVTGSEFESNLTLYHAAASLLGLDEARRRLKLRTPYFLRFTAENAYPRVYSTNRLSRRALANFYGPFPSRAAADRYCDAVLDLFKLRRCYEDLAPAPEHPGCVYQEMKKCLAPCNQACTPEGAAAYSAEAAAVQRFFETHSESMLSAIAAEREAASAELDFERAASLHAQWQKVKAAAALADELVAPIPRLRAILIQKAAGRAGDDEPAAAVFLLNAGCIAGPERLSTLGVRAVKEQTSVGSSLFAQPLMLQAIPLDEPTPNAVILSEAGSAESKALEEPSVTDTAAIPNTKIDPTAAPTLNPEARAAAVIASLESRAAAPSDPGTLSDHLSLLRRWYYRPEKQRSGEIFFPRPDAAAGETAWPIRRILNASARAALGEPKQMAETNRDLAARNPADAAQKPVRTKVLHAGRPDVERVVPVLGPAANPPAFRSRKPPKPN